MSVPLISLDATVFRREPFPIGRALNVIEPTLYERLVDSFPPMELFRHKVAKKDDKFYLNEVKTRRVYLDWINDHADWRELHRWIKSKDFAFYVLDFLKSQNLDLGVKREHPPLTGQARRILGDLIWRKRYPRFERSLSTRFEFSALTSNGGFICPHTDAPHKIVTLVVTMVKPGEWDPQWGGGLEVNQVKNVAAHGFNYMNRVLEFDDVEPVETFAFVPNQCVVFIKTVNSYHCVRRMETGEPARMRRTITINIEYE